MSGPCGADVLALDVGNSKSHLALVSADGSLLAAVSGPTASHQAVGFEQGSRVIEGLAAEACARAGLPALQRPVARIIVDCTAGADFAFEDRRIAASVGRLGLAERVVVRNDTFAALRAGTIRPWGVAVICGYGINCAGRARDGRMFRFPSVGEISGDWGGGAELGHEALAAAVRGRDGRGHRTLLEELVPAHFGRRRPLDVTQALYGGRIPSRRLFELSPLVFEAAIADDAVARALVDRLADEIVGMALVALRRCRLIRTDADVVLGGGVFRTEDARFHDRIRDRLRDGAPRATPVRLTAPPVLGAALLGLDALGETNPGVESRLRTELRSESVVVVWAQEPVSRSPRESPPGRPRAPGSGRASGRRRTGVPPRP